MDKALGYELDCTFAPPELLHACAEQYGTPLLIYDGDTLDQRQKMLEDVFAWNPGFRQSFPVRCADEPEILRILAQRGGLVCSGHMELKLAKMAGVPGDKILFGAAFPKREVLQEAADLGCTVLLNSLEQLSQYMSLERKPNRVVLRVQPEKEFSIPGHMPYLKEPSKFGMQRKDLLLAASKLRDEPLEEFGLFLQMTGNERLSGYLGSVARALMQVCPEIEECAGRKVDWCDLGGGLAMPTGKRTDLELGKEAELVKQALEEARRPQMPIRTQMGRFLAGPAGIFLTEVVGVRYGQRNFLGVDASLADLPRAAMMGMPHHVSLLGNAATEGRVSYYIEGASMEKADSYGKRHVLPPTKEGDILVFHNAGAYTRSMASNYGGSLRCPVLLLEDGQVRLLRRREREEDYFRLLLDQK